MTTCNWYWGSHGCGLPPRHDGDHICDPEEPCSYYADGKVVFVYTDGSGRSEPVSMIGYCNGPMFGPCGDKKYCYGCTGKYLG